MGTCMVFHDSFIPKCFPLVPGTGPGDDMGNKDIPSPYNAEVYNLESERGFCSIVTKVYVK